MSFNTKDLFEQSQDRENRARDQQSTENFLSKRYLILQTYFLRPRLKLITSINGS